MADQTDAGQADAGKGRPTPSRKEAEAARKQQMKTPLSRKELAKRDRVAREDIRLRQREALKSGEERYLPPRDQGPVRRYTRDHVDRRWNIAEFLLPFVVVAFVLSLGGGNGPLATILVGAVYPAVIIGTIIDEVFLVRGLRRELRSRFGDDAVRGSASYAVLRSTQLRRFRLPKPQVKRGEVLGSTYR